MELPCCVYMHAQSPWRGPGGAAACAQHGCTLFSISVARYGMELVILGWYERDDCECVIDYLRASGTVSLIGLWGEHGSRDRAHAWACDNTIAAMILDSSFASLEMLVYELYKRADLRFVPRFMVAVALRVVRSTVLKRAGFDILKLRPCDNVEKCHIPAIFVCATGDNFIHPSHSEKIHENYGGEYKNLIRIDGDHNTNRPRFCMDSIGIFLYQWLCKPTGLTEKFLKEKRTDLLGARKARGGGCQKATLFGGMVGRRAGHVGATSGDLTAGDDAELQRVYCCP